jgi:hypothetical protein
MFVSQSITKLCNWFLILSAFNTSYMCRYFDVMRNLLFCIVEFGGILGPFSSNSSPKFHYVKRRFLITSKYRQMHGVLNVDEIKN